MTDDPVCGSAIILSTKTQDSSHPMVWFSAINHFVCIGVIFAYSGYFNLVQDLCRLLPVETNNIAERCPAEWIWFPCWKRFVQANVIQPSCYYSSNSSIQNLPASARPPAPAASRQCTEVQRSDVRHATWQIRLNEQRELKVVAGIHPKHDETTDHTKAQWEISRPTVK